MQRERNQRLRGRVDLLLSENEELHNRLADLKVRSVNSAFVLASIDHISLVQVQLRPSLTSQDTLMSKQLIRRMLGPLQISSKCIPIPI